MLAAGFADPVFDAQASFRALLEALSNPGRIVTLPAESATPEGVPPAVAAALLTLTDFETPVWLPAGLRPSLGAWLRFHAGAPLVDKPEDAAFAVLTGGDDEPDLSKFRAGDDLYPDTSATVLIACPALEAGAAMVLSGPGIPETVPVDPIIVPANFWPAFRRNCALYPRGVDVILACGNAVMGLPRSLTVTEGVA